MPVTKVTSEDVDQRLFETFCSLGYDGASMETLSASTGLKKASLYHRFPGGKKQMGLHVLANVESWIDTYVLSIAENEKIPVKKRLKEVLAAIDELYDGGAANCTLRMLSVGPDAATFLEIISRCFQKLTEGFAAIGRANGLGKAIALQRAKEIVAMIQGSLVLAGAMKDTSYFKNCLSGISNLLK